MTAWQPSDPDQATRLCIDCGLCCSGSIFGHAEIAPGDEDIIAALGMDTITGDDGTGQTISGIALPCRHLDGTRCSVYTRQRPAVYGAFFCRLSKKLDRGEVSFDEAAAKVAQAHELLRQLAPFMKPGETPVAARVRWANSHDEWLASPENARFHFLMSALNMLFDRHFRGSNQSLLRFSASGDNDTPSMASDAGET